MRAARKMAILEILRQAERPLVDAEIADQLGVSRATARPLRAELVREGAVEPVASAPGSHYPISGWQISGRDLEPSLVERGRPGTEATGQIAQRVLATLRACGPLTTGHIASRIGRGWTTAYSLCEHLRHEGRVERVGYCWREVGS